MMVSGSWWRRKGLHLRTEEAVSKTRRRIGRSEGGVGEPTRSWVREGVQEMSNGLAEGRGPWCSEGRQLPKKRRSSRAFRKLGPENQENPANQTEVARIKSKRSGNSTPFRCGISKSRLLILRAFWVKWLWKILTFGVSQHFKALRGHLAPLTVIYALKYW